MSYLCHICASCGKVGEVQQQSQQHFIFVSRLTGSVQSGYLVAGGILVGRYNITTTVTASLLIIVNAVIITIKNSFKVRQKAGQLRTHTHYQPCISNKSHIETLSPRTLSPACNRFEEEEGSCCHLQRDTGGGGLGLVLQLIAGCQPSKSSDRHYQDDEQSIWGISDDNKDDKKICASVYDSVIRGEGIL